MSGRLIKVSRLSWVQNVCNQRLREVWKSDKASIAYVEMNPGNVSLDHQHREFTELYYILSGEGLLLVGEKNFFVREDMLVEIPPNTVHRLENLGTSILRHLVISLPPFNPDDVEVING